MQHEDYTEHVAERTHAQAEGIRRQLAYIEKEMDFDLGTAPVSDSLPVELARVRELLAAILSEQRRWNGYSKPHDRTRHMLARLKHRMND